MVTLYEIDEENAFDASALAEIEQKLGLALPNDYKGFVLSTGDVAFIDDGVTSDFEWRRSNGAAIQSDETEDFEDEYMLLVLDGPEEIIENINVLHGHYRQDGVGMLPKHLFPFTAGATREYLLISLAPKDHGSVYLYFPSDDPWGTGENNYLGYIASSFTDFIENKIRPYE